MTERGHRGEQMDIESEWIGRVHHGASRLLEHGLDLLNDRGSMNASGTNDGVMGTQRRGAESVLEIEN